MPAPLPPNLPPTIPYIFDYATWIMTFPEFAGVGQPQADLYFGIATSFVKNDGTGPVRNPHLLRNLLNLTTAHVAKLFSMQSNGQPSSSGGEAPAGLVGRISSATEGSVSVSTEFESDGAASAWWNQTQYGVTAYRMLAPFRTMRYLPGPRRRYNPPVRGGGFFGGGLGGL
jgi:hypothetical protein